MSNTDFWINPNWQNKNLQCHFCRNTQSVKYKTKVVIIDTIPASKNAEKEICICNKCALFMHEVIDACNTKKD